MARTTARTGLSPKLIALAVASCFAAGAALANPTGPALVNGTASVVQNGNLLQITNSPNTVINWQSFSIGANEITRFIQQSQSSGVLNRVTGAGGTIDPSVILGALQSNGRVFLINPSGILFGAGAQIDVAGLIASSLALSNEDFLTGRLRFTGVPGAGSVINQGTITSGAGGNIYLVGPAVTNSGIITSPQGEVILAAGNSVELVNPGTPDLRVEISALDHEARNLGRIIADSGRIGIYAGLIDNSGTIRADSAVNEGGRILLKATKSVTLENSSVLSAQGQGGGKIKVLAGDHVHVAGWLDASAPNVGDGGFIETSAAKVQVDPGAVITTAAPRGITGTWLIDPSDFTIAPTGGDITGTLLSTNLGLSSVVITSDLGLVNPLGNGDIFVNDTVTWSSGNSLTLTAVNQVHVNKPITGLGLASVLLNSGTGVIQSVEGAITANQLYARGGSGSVLLNNADNRVNVLAGTATGEFQFGNAQALEIGTIAAANANGINVVNPTGPSAVNINVTSGDLTVNKSVTAQGGTSGVTAAASISMTAGAGAISVNGTPVNVTSISAISGGSPSVNGGPAGVTLNAGGGIALSNGSVNATGAAGPTGGSGTATLSAGGGITLSGSSVNASGGAASSGAGGDATVTLKSGGDIALASSVNASAGAGSPAGTARIFLTFLTAAGNFSVNGMTGSIVDNTLGRVGEGFFVDSLPAIRDVNLFVTNLGAPLVNDILVATVDRQVDVLADQLRAGEIGGIVEEEKKTLPQCN